MVGVVVVSVLVIFVRRHCFANASWANDELLNIFGSLLAEPCKTAFELGFRLLLVFQVRNVSRLKGDHLLKFMLQGTL